MVDMTEAEINARKRLRSATPPATGNAWVPANQASITPPGSTAVEGRLVDVPEGFDPHAHVRGRQPVEPKVFVHGETDMDVDPEKEEAVGKKRALLMSGSLDGTIKIWDVDTGLEEKTLFGHIEGVWGVDVDALRIASASHGEYSSSPAFCSSYDS